MAVRDIDAYIGQIPGKDMSRYYGIIERYAGVKYRHYAVERGTGRLLLGNAGCATHDLWEACTGIQQPGRGQPVVRGRLAIGRAP